MYLKYQAIELLEQSLESSSSTSLQKHKTNEFKNLTFRDLDIIYNALGEAYQKIGNHEKALEQYKKLEIEQT